MIGAIRLKYGARFACATLVAVWAIAAPARAETEAVDAQVAIVTPGQFIKVEDLHFGVVLPGATAGTVVMAANGTRTRTGGVTLAGNLHHPAEFAGRKPGNGNAPVSISVGANTIQLTGPGAPMTVRLFRGNTNPAQNLTITPRNFQVQGQSNGTFELKVGATLDVNANQTPGTYSGTWTITLDYN
ncbi:MAG: hypothetical protein RL481_395 [Pseudomonadota bacterium]|jgi:hypothetical protein